MAVALFLKAGQPTQLVKPKHRFYDLSTSPRSVPKSNLAFPKLAKFSVKCAIISNPPMVVNSRLYNLEGHSMNSTPKRNNLEVVGNAVTEALRKPLKTAALVVLTMMTVNSVCNSAFALSGGTIGGSYQSHDTSTWKSEEAVCAAGYVIGFVIGLIFSIYYLWILCHTPLDIIELQVATLDTSRVLQKDINRIAKGVDTSTSVGWIHLLHETTNSLLQRSEYWTSGYSAVTKDVMFGGEGTFNGACSYEEERFSELTFVKINSNMSKSITSERTDGLSNGYTVVTIVLMAIGDLDLPTIESRADIEKTLQTITSIPDENIEGVRVFWGPQRENESLLEHELHKRFPFLRDRLTDKSRKCVDWRPEFSLSN